MSFQATIKSTWQRQEKTLVRVGANADYTPGGNFDIFLIAVGPIRLTSMFGHVRVACTANVLVPLISYWPTPTGVGAITAIATVAVGAIWPIDTLLVWDGTLADVLAPSVGLGHGQAGPASTEGFVAGEILMLPGTMVIVNATADATAEIDWYISYIPVTAAAQVTVL